MSYSTHSKNQAFRIAAHSLDTTRAVDSLTSTSLVQVSKSSVIASTAYTPRMDIRVETPCVALATSSVAWVEGSRSKDIQIGAAIYDLQRLLFLGGDCEISVDVGDWSRPLPLAQGVLPKGKPTAVDVLNEVLYLGGSVAPYLFISDTRSVSDGETISFVSFVNNLSLPEHIAFLDVARQRHSSGDTKTYLYAAINAPQEQLYVMDVTDIYNPTIVARRSLRNVSPTGSEPMGHRLVYYASRVYITTKYTAGPELHIFDVSDPYNPTELGSGVEVGATINALAIQERFIRGVKRRFLYTATSQLHNEVRVFDVTDPFNSGAVSEVLAATVDLSGSQNAQSLFILGDLLYVGRASTPTGPDLYAFSITDPTAGLSEVMSQDVGTGVMGLVATHSRMWLLTSKVTKELQVWGYGREFSIASLYAMSGAAVGGFDYERGRLYITGQGTSSVQILVGE